MNGASFTRRSPPSVNQSDCRAAIAADGHLAMTVARVNQCQQERHATFEQRIHGIGCRRELRSRESVVLRPLPLADVMQPILWVQIGRSRLRRDSPEGREQVEGNNGPPPIHRSRHFQPDRRGDKRIGSQPLGEGQVEGLAGLGGVLAPGPKSPQ